MLFINKIQLTIFRWIKCVYLLFWIDCMLLHKLVSISYQNWQVCTRRYSSWFMYAHHLCIWMVKERSFEFVWKQWWNQRWSSWFLWKSNWFEENQSKIEGSASYWWMVIWDAKVQRNGDVTVCSTNFHLFGYTFPSQARFWWSWHGLGIPKGKWRQEKFRSASKR